MKYAKRQKRTYSGAKRVSKRRYTSRVKRSYVPKRSLGPIGFPRLLKMTHKYVSAPTQLNCVGGNMSLHVFCANGMFDPDISATGHQPMYFDQMALIYNHYTVIGSKITIQVQTTEEVLGPMIGCLWIDDDSITTSTSLSEVAERGRYPLVNFGGPNSDPRTTFKAKWSAKKFFGKGAMANNALQGTGSANPSEISNYKFAYNTVDGTSATIYLTVSIEYIAIWSELKETAQS